ncbi:MULTISPECIES: DUF2497 domain-containing protein [unclassified Beijerinckia]|uniref:PopZ family protein n=1 Tax=unclassified Beijerinckia TaxID=2638183 RepID=UPI000898A8A9|nr:MULTISPECIES: DUF2497 domain-containing protein [unclassified Beijerinckia]MDH7795258.1 cell pole-organizing protein PopZ [Beijerinckia sp. GAS462]SEB94057.1 hypothetical protein SAMN05443249_1531 [Beijerinckia sp. 28-YEA-48]
MNAIPAPQSAQSAASSKAGSDPTMEEILASIRRIIADDQVLPLTPRPARPTLVEPPPAQAPAAEVRSPEVSAAKPAAAKPTAAAKVAAEPVVAEPEIADDDMSWLEEAALPLRASIVEQPAVVPPPRIRRVSDEDFIRTVNEGRSEPRTEPRTEQRTEPRKIRSEPTVQPLLSAETNASVATAFQSLAQSVLLRDPGVMENMARDLLRPMLKQWLDDNLPPLVERLVRAEIERAARGGR